MEFPNLLYLEILDKELNSDDNWFNQVEAEFVKQSFSRKRRNIRMRWRGAIVVTLVLSGLTIGALIGQRNALIGQINASQEASEANLLANKGLDSLISSLQAIESLIKSFKLETSEELIVRGCNLVRDYLQKNPKVSDSDRHLCDDVPVSVTSQFSTIPSPTTSPFQE